jgi:hypothetical protein
MAFDRVADRILPDSGTAEAMWLYQRLLEAVTLSAGDPKIKSLTLRIGRIAHAKGRPNGVPTVYDEQAIANDIAARTA